MTVQERQAALDKAKWEASEAKGYDVCGEFDYCAKCNKDDEYPCAKAYESFHAKPKAAAKPAAAKKAPAKKAPAKK